MKKIIFCLPGDNFSHHFFNSWTNLLGSVILKGFAVSLSQSSGSNVYDVRNKCLSGEFSRGVKQAPWDGKIDYDYLMWIDSDMVFNIKHFIPLIESDKDIIGGVYRNVHGFYSCGNWDQGDPFSGKGGTPWSEKELLEYKKLGSPIEVDYSGFGWMLMKKGIMEAIDYPWFEPEIYEFDGKRGYFAEDVSWCRKVQKAGFKVFVHPEIIVGHEKRWILS